MPRLNRCYGHGFLHFITFSCYRRLRFLGTAQRRDTLLRLLEQTRKSYRFVVVGYVVMPEHVHLLISEPERGDPGTVVQVAQTALCARRAPRSTNKYHRDPGRIVGRFGGPRSPVAGAFLRFCGLHEKEETRKAALHASEPNQTRLGVGAATVAMEQLSGLRARRARAGTSERALTSKDEG